MNRKERKAEQLARHYNNLATLFTMCGGVAKDGKVYSGRQLSLKLWKLEKAANKAATDWANGDLTEAQYEAKEGPIKAEVENLFPTLEGFFCNGDPRGYALKIRTETMKAKGYPLTTDWGGFGILSPEIDGN